MAGRRVRRHLVYAASAALLASMLGASPGSATTAGATGSEQPRSSAADPTPTPEAGPTPSPELSPAPSLSPSPAPTYLSPDGPEDDYIVAVRSAAFIDPVKEKAQGLGGTPDRELVGAVDGFTARLSPQDVATLERDPNVLQIERDEIVRISGAVSGYVDCDATTMPRTDDGGAGPVSLGFNVNWFGVQYSSIYINTNGGIVFNDGLGPFTTFRGIDIESATRPYILPLFTDIDTRNSPGQITYGPLDNANPSAGFCINWVDVGEFGSSRADYSFQLIITNQGSGEIDVEFNYDTISLPTNIYNNVFAAGYADPRNRLNSVTLASPGTPPATVRNSLVGGSFPITCTVAGRHIYQVRAGGTPAPPTDDQPSDGPSAAPSPSPTQTNPPWGLDRIDENESPWVRDNRFVSPGTFGQSVAAYVVDTGILSTHNDFRGRALASGIDTIDSDTNPADCNGHGTHVAGTIAGAEYGVAKMARIVGVRVLGCTGSGTTSGVIAGLNQIASFHAARIADGTFPVGTRAVVNMSLGGSKSTLLDTAVRSLVNTNNIPVVVAAGNSTDDAQFYSPAGETTAITVAASTSSDAMASFSNYGSVIDIFAPGQSIQSAWYTSNSATNTLSGTSMASPHVAGAAALYLANNPSASASSVGGALRALSTLSVVLSGVPSNTAGTATTRKILYVGTGVFPSGLGARSATVDSATDTGSDEASPSVPVRAAIESQCTSRDSGGSPSSGGGGGGGGGGSGGGGSGGGGGGSGGGGSGGGSSGGGSGGGGLNAITTIVPSTSGAPGTPIALAGWGLETTRDVKFNDVSARFTVVNGRQIDVIVPDVPPGVYVIHAVLAPEVGRASFWSGFSVRERRAQTPVTPPVSSSPSKETSTDVARESADYVLFPGTSTNVSAAARAKLRRLAQAFAGSDVRGTIVAFFDPRGSAASTARAELRAERLKELLQDAGVTGTLGIVTEPASTALQGRGALIYLEPANESGVSENSDVSSLIVRLKRGRSISVDGAVRGADNVTGGLADALKVGPYLGLRMYRIDFERSVSDTTAERVARQLMQDPGIEFVEPDSLVTTQVAITR